MSQQPRYTHTADGEGDGVFVSKMGSGHCWKPGAHRRRRPRAYEGQDADG